MSRASQILLFANGRTREASPMCAWLSGLLGLDLRSLAVYRIGMGLLLLSDLILRSRDLLVFYTDDGILPRGVSVYRPSQLMLHQLSGSAWYEAMLFIIAGFFALLMLVGCWTRVATCVSWLLLASLQARIPLTNDGAQDLMRVLMFWNMFLPLGARYSVDAALNVSFSQRTQRVMSVATFALMVQLCTMYWMSYKFKTSPEWLREGSAVYYALSLDMLATPVGIWLRQFPVLLRGLTYFVMRLEAMTPLLCFFPWPNALFRIVLIVLICGMHAGFAVCMWIEIFPFLCIVAWMAFVPTVVWDGLANWLKSPRRQGLALYYDSASLWGRRWALLARTFCILPQMPIRRLATSPELTELAQQRSSLVLTDAQGGRYCGFAALAEMMTRSPVAWPLGWLFSKFPARKVPTHRAAPVPARRGTFDWLTVLLPLRRAPLCSRGITLAFWLISQVIVAMCLVFVIGHNLEQIGIRAIDFGAIPQMVRSPSTFPDAMLATGAMPGKWQWNFSPWMQRKTFWIGERPVLLWKSYYELGRELRLDQRWSMFAPHPLKRDGWFVLAAQLEDRSTIDLWTDEPVTYARPRWLANKFPNYRWFKFMENFLEPGQNAGFHPYIGRYYCRNWNRRHPHNKIVELNIYFMVEDNRPPYIPPPPKDQEPPRAHIMRWICGSGPW